MNWPTLIDRTSVDRLGVEFPYKGDTVIWLWPWRRNGKPKFISVGFSGTGEFGDARFPTLKSMDEAWAKCIGDMKNLPFVV